MKRTILAALTVAVLSGCGNNPTFQTQISIAKSNKAMSEEMQKQTILLEKQNEILNRMQQQMESSSMQNYKSAEPRLYKED